MMPTEAVDSDLARRLRIAEADRDALLRLCVCRDAGTEKFYRVTSSASFHWSGFRERIGSTLLAGPYATRVEAEAAVLNEATMRGEEHEEDTP